MAKILIIAGCICIAFSVYLYKERYNPVHLSIATYKNSLKVHSVDLKKAPVAIQIRTLNIHLPILPARITNGTWETTSQGVSYLASSPVPGSNGNSILYGHNWPSILGALPQVKPGQIITIYFSDGSYNDFEIEKTAIINPDQIGILDPTSDRRLTLYTCTGFLDSKRFVAVAILKS